MLGEGRREALCSAAPPGLGCAVLTHVRDAASCSGVKLHRVRKGKLMRRWSPPLWFIITLITAGSAEAALPYINATDPPFNIIADGQTPMDAQLAFAVAACGTAGNPRTLWLPAGQILLTGTQSINLKDCNILGQGIIGATSGDPASFGTTILLTSTSTVPFTIGSNWSIQGLNFYWPNQTTGTTPYPALFQDNGSAQANLVLLDHVNIINAYDGFVQTTGVGWGNWIVSNSEMYAVHDLFRLGTLGDAIHFNAVHFDPAAWLSLCAFACQNAVNAADRVNTIFHATASTTGFGLIIDNSITFAWRYGLKLDSGAFVGASNINMSWDGTGTLVDSSSGGDYAVQNRMSGTADCSVPVFGGTSTSNFPCFNLGPVRE